MKLQLKNCRLAFPQLFVATKVDENSKPAFSAAFLLKPDDPQIKAINAAIDAVAKEKWKDKATVQLATLRAQDRVALHDGNLKSQYDGYPGMMFVNSRSAMKPLVIDADKTPLVESSGRPYAGCYVNAHIDIYAQDNPKYGKRVNAALRGIQFVRDGDAFAGSPPASDDEFEDMSEGADAASLV